MTRSPYSPPGAPVEDPPPEIVVRGRRPWPISAALLLLFVVLVNEFARLAGGRDYLVFASLFWIGALTTVVYFIELSRNWARWLLFVLTVSSALSFVRIWLEPTPENLRYLPDVAHVVRSLGAELCLIGATLFVFGPGRGWFRR